MGRKKKTLLQALKASSLAHLLTVLAGGKPNGYQLARWYERRRGLPHGSECNSTWGRFLEGLMPQKAKLTVLLDLAPALIHLLDHPIWKILSEKEDSAKLFEMFERTRYLAKTNYLSSLEDNISTMPALDRIALLLLILLSAAKHAYVAPAVTDWLADSYAQLKLEPEWLFLSQILLKVILVRLDSISWFSSSRFMACNSEWNHKFWRAVFDDYMQSQPGSGSAAWAAWCSSISRLDWLGQETYLKYIQGSSCFDSQDKNIQGRRIYNKVRDRRYKLIRNARGFSIDLLMDT